MIWLNGTIVAAENAISAHDRGLLLGESLFETLLLKHRVPQFWDAHLARLRAGLQAYGLQLPYQPADLKAGLRALLAQTDSGERAVLRLSVTGGDGGRGLVPPADTDPNVMMQISPAAAPPDHIGLVLCDVMRPAGQAQQAHKTGAYLDNILARRQALAAGADEAVMCNQYGRIACAAAGNIFAAFGKHLITPPVSEGALPGIIRGALLQSQKVGLWQIGEGLIEADRLTEADAIFVTNSVQGVVAAHMVGQNNPTKKRQGADLSSGLNDALPEFSEF